MQRQGQLQQLAHRNHANNINSTSNNYEDLSYNYKQQKIQDLEVLNSEIYDTLAFKNIDSINNYGNENHLTSFNHSNNINNNSNIFTQPNFVHSNQENIVNRNNINQNKNSKNNVLQNKQQQQQQHQQTQLKKFPKKGPPLQPPAPQLKPPLKKHTNNNLPSNPLSNKSHLLGQHRISNKIANSNIKSLDPVAQRHLANHSNEHEQEYYYRQDLHGLNNLNNNNFFNNNPDEIVSIDSYLSNQTNKNSINSNKDYRHVTSKVNTNLKNKQQQQQQQQHQSLEQHQPLVNPYLQAPAPLVYPPLFEKNMKTKNNQSSFAKNPTHSYSDQFYSSLPGYPVPNPKQKLPPFMPPMPPGSYYPPIYPPQYAAAMAAAAAAYGYPPYTAPFPK